jgi:hypothetical protein
MARDPNDDALALRALRQFQSAQPDAAIVVATVTDGETDDSQIVAMRLSHHSPLHLIAAAQALLQNAMDELTQSGAPNSDAVPRLQSALAALAQSAWPLQPRCVRSLRRQGKPLCR